MAEPQNQQQQVVQLFTAAIAGAKALKNSEVEARLTKVAKHLAAGKLFVVVCGEFKRGKSSLINAMISDPGVFPVDVDIATNLVTTIAYAPQERITAVVGEPGQEEKVAISRAQIADYVTEGKNHGNFRQARLLVVETPNEYLKDGLILVDTPGVGGLQQGHNEATYAFIPNADALLFVCDALAPLTTEELDFIKRMAQLCPNIIFVMTKIDLKQKGERQLLIDNNRDKLADILRRPKESINFLQVSSRHKLAYLKSGDDEDLEDSNFPAFDKALRAILRDRQAEVLLLRGLAELGKGVTELERPLQAEALALSERGQGESKDLEQRFEEAKEQLQALQASNAEWRLQLSQGLQDIKSGTLNDFQDGYIELKRRAETYLDDARAMANPAGLVTQLEAEMDHLVITVMRALVDQTTELSQNIQTSAGLTLQAFDPGTPQRQRRGGQVDWSRIKDPTLWDKAMELGKDTNKASAPMSSFGAILGGAVGLMWGPAGIAAGVAIGSKLGRTAGMAAGAKQGIAQMPFINKPEVTRLVNRFLDDSQRDCTRMVNQTLTEMERAMQRELADQIAERRGSCEQAVKLVQESRKLSVEDVGKRLTQVKAQHQQLVQVRKNAEALLGTLVARQEQIMQGRPQQRIAQRATAQG